MTRTTRFAWLLALVLAVGLWIQTPQAQSAIGDMWALQNVSGTDVIRLTSAGDLVPGGDNLYDLGSAALSWNDIHIDGTATIAALTMSGDLNMGNNLVLNVGDAGTDFVAGGGLTLAGVLTANGNVDLGNANTDTLSLVADVDTDLTFDPGAARTIGIRADDTAGDQLNLTGHSGGTGAVAGGVVALTAGAGGSGGAAGEGAGAPLTVTGGAAGGTGAANGGDVILLGGALADTGAAGVVRVGAPTLGSTRATNLLAVAGGLEVDGGGRFDGNVTLGDLNTDTITLTGDVATDVTWDPGAARTLTIRADDTAGDALQVTGMAGGVGDVAGGAVTITAGDGGTGSVAAGHDGGALTLEAGTAGTDGAGAGTGGVGGAVNITGGAAADSGANAGGSVILLAGAATGGGAEGIVQVGAPTVGGTRATNYLAVGGGFEVDGAARFDGVATIGDGGDTVAISSSDWAIDATGIMTGIGAITADGLLTGTAGATLSGAAISLNASSNFVTNIGTGTSTGAVAIGGNLNTVAIDSSDWDIDATGAILGVAFDANGAGNTLSNVDAADLTIDSLNFAQFLDAMTLDAATSITGAAANVLSIARTLTDATAENGVLMTFVASDVAGAVTTQFGLYLDNLASTEGLDAMLVIDNSDADDAVGAAIRFIDAGGTFTSLFDVAGTLLSAAEVNLLDAGITLAELTDSGTLTAGTVDINGGNVDGTAVGAAVASTGAFTTLSSTGVTTIGNTTATVAIDSSDWDIDATGAVTGVAFNANAAGNTLTNVDAADLTVDSIDFAQLVDAMTIDVSTTFTGAAGVLLTIARTLTDAVAQNGVVMNFTASDTTSATTAQYGLYLDNLAAAEGLDAALVIDNSDADDSVGAAIRFVDAGGTFVSLFDVAGTLLSAAEVNLLDAGITLAELTDTGTLTATTVDINGGNIDGTVIGAAVRAAASVTTINANGNATLGDTAADTHTVNGDLDIVDPSNGDGGSFARMFGRLSIATTAGTGLVNTGYALIDDMEGVADWVATANVTNTDDAVNYRYGASSLEMAFAAAAADGNGADKAIANEDWSTIESIGMWIRTDTALASGDLAVEITDSVAGATEVVIPAVATTGRWTFVKVDISGVAAASRDVVSNVAIDITVQGVAALAAFTIEVDSVIRWDDSGDLALTGDAIDGGMVQIWANATASASNFAPTVLVEGTDWWLDPSTSSFLIFITDQSANQVVASYMTE